MRRFLSLTLFRFSFWATPVKARVGIPLSIFLLFAAFSASAQCGCTDCR
ncbi:MAG: hypothetical protein U5L45_00915 [Saprospiraceae bacterium]|nr:hypothetical protein [Saprospiraceae bacterium]